mgnify:CR=1 FL=1
MLGGAPNESGDCGSTAASGTLEARVASNLVELLMHGADDGGGGGDGVLVAPGALTEYVAGFPVLALALPQY